MKKNVFIIKILFVGEERIYIQQNQFNEKKKKKKKKKKNAASPSPVAE